MFMLVILSASYRPDSISTLLHRIEDLDEDDFDEQQGENMERALHDYQDLRDELSLKLDKLQVLPNDSNEDGKQQARWAWETITWDQKEIDNYRSRILLSLTSFNLLVGRIDLYVVHIFLSANLELFATQPDRGLTVELCDIKTLSPEEVDSMQ
ncbi:ankyrin [Penicillium cataractarum]|uniref:Ankyrin n=1 Tax=Penicillium cataractarum TaxID=2100454 RepID=A0A9W9RQF0_9EURO|nr:ankyrin [Penicillium cataractarum]KAJ5364518.1 ankyrin [Penicillium cataractarum]